MVVGPSAKRETAERVMATSGILFMLTTIAFKCFLLDECRRGNFRTHFSRTSANYASPLISKMTEKIVKIT